MRSLTNSINRSGIIILGIILIIISSEGCKSQQNTKPLASFSTGGHIVYHLQPARIKKSGDKAIISAAYDGTILCHDRKGKLLWKTKINEYFPFDLAVADIDNDELDEVFVATAGGTVDAYDNNGSHMWSFTREAPLYQVCPIKTAAGEWLILTGGIEEVLFSLSVKGSQIGSIKAGDVVRHIRKGDILGDGNEYAAVTTASIGRNGNLSLMLISPDSLKTLWVKRDLEKDIYYERERFMSMIIFDSNDDGKEDIVLSSSWEYNGLILGFDYTGEMIIKSSDKKIPNVNYRMHLLTHVKPENLSNEHIFSLYANYLIIYSKTGVFQSILKSNYDFANIAFDPETNTCFLGSGASGGDGIYALNLNIPGWETAFETLKPVGRLAEVEKNIELLTQQIAKFKKPLYQKDVENIYILGSVPEEDSYENLHFASRPYLQQKYESQNELWNKHIDKRFKYKRSAEEIVEYARDKETKKENFYVVAGHSAAVYMPLSTMEKIIETAPVHFQGFVFAELQATNSDMKDVIEKIIYPLAKICSKAEKKIVFENKNIFWGGTCYVDFWRNILLNPEFHDVFLPALEESNSRTQEISLAGRVGLWSIGIFDNWLSRSISDNPCFNRWWEWSSQQVLSHYLRHLVLTSSMGSDVIAVGIHQGPMSGDLSKQMLPLYSLLDKGVVAIPKKDELISISDLCLGMKSPPSEKYLKYGTNSHRCDFDEITQTPMVFDRLDNYWGGAPLKDHDFSSYGYGCDRRMLNFLPVNPYGLIAIVPDDIDIEKFPRFKEKVTTDGEFFYDNEGNKRDAVEYKDLMMENLRQSADRLPVLVKGEVAWSVVRLDSNHVRITLVDPGYIDPAARDAEVNLQNISGIDCIDILSNESIPIIDQKINLTVPAGIFRIIDIKHR